MKGLVIYKSKYGAARQYAHWVGNDINFPVINVKDVTRKQLQDARILVIGSSIYIGKALIRRWLSVHKKELANKIVFFFLVAGTPPDKTIELEKYAGTSIPPELYNRSQVFFFPGKLIYQKLSWPDRITLRMGAMFMKKKGQKDILQDYNEVKREHINEMVAVIKNIITEEETPLQEPEGSYPDNTFNTNNEEVVD